MLFRQLFDTSGSSTYTYLLCDEASREGILIDPVLEMLDRDLRVVQELDVKLVLVVNTHCHADHLTSTGAIKERIPGVKSAIGKASGATADVLLEEGGDQLKFGDRYLTVRSTPGHTNGCITLVLDDESMCFTGDTLLIRGCGRTDFQDGDSGTLYNSVHSKIFTLPESCAVYPAHDYKGRTVSSVGEEKRLNPRLSKPKEEFVEIMANLKLAMPKRLVEAVPWNICCGIDVL